MERTQEIAKKNDDMRKGLKRSKTSRVTLTPLVYDSPDIDAILEAVKNFDNFTDENDPYGEHDFGSVMVNGKTVFFKIDYYDSSLSYGADPQSEDTVRVITIMLAEEY